MKEEKAIIRQREEYKCFFCESKTNLTAAHIFVWKKDGGKCTQENLMCLCRECHDKMDFCKGITREEQIRMLRQCMAYLTFYYCDYDTQREIPKRKLKK
jgi:predicted restriction endonuclease